MQQKIIYSSMFWLIRIAAIIEIALDIAGMLWFKNYYFSGKYVGENLILILPTIALGIGAFAPDKILAIRSVYPFVLGMFFLGMASLAYSMYGDLTLVNAPDYSAFWLRFIPLGLILAFTLRAYYCQKANPTMF